MSRLSILTILTSGATMGETGEPTGMWFEELATPHFAFVNAGAAVTLTSIAGGAVPVDPRSRKPIGENEASVDRFLGDETGMAALTSSSATSEVDDADHDAVFLPGGHRTMRDLPDSRALADLLRRAWSPGKAIAAVCHGPAGLGNATDEAGEPLVKGRRVAAFSDSDQPPSSGPGEILYQRP